jgi:dTDP-4-dehydrorhamnose reductase
MRVLVIGGTGQLGTEIQRRWTGDEIVAPARADLDIEDAPALAEALESIGPEVVVNCAAFHNVDRCEETPERAFAVNALAVDRLARMCRDRDAVFVTISTDYVFDGSATRPYGEDDPLRPISAYGVSKLAGELMVERLRSHAFVVRTCGVYGIRTSTGKGHTFVDRILAQARAGEPSRVVRDVIVSPTFAGDLARALRELLATGAYGLYHAVNPGPVSWYDFACEALAQAGVEGHIEPISALDWTAPARRPAFSALDNAKIRSLGIALPSWREGIAAYLNLRAGDPGA